MGEKITIRPLTQLDKPVLANLANNRKIWNNLRDYIPFPYKISDAEAFINTTEQQNPRSTFAIEYNGKFAGVIGLVIQKDVYRRSAEIGYWIGEPYWGKGIATKALALVTEYGFKKLDLIRIYSGVFEFNKASMRVLEKNGYELEGIFKNAVVKNDNVCNEHRFYKLK